MKKRYYFFTAALVLMAMFATACSNKQTSGAPANKDLATPTASNGEDSKNKTTDKNPTYTIKVGHVEAEDRSTHIALLAFQKYVEEQTNNDVTVEIHPNGLLGGDVELTQGVQLGTIQMTLPATSALVAFSPKFGILDMPFLFEDPQMAFNALDGELGAELDKALDNNGFINFGYSYNGQRSLTNSLRPVNEPADLKGMKVRVMQSPVYISLFKALGANPTPMAFGEVFTALQQKTVDAQENAPSLIYAMKYYEAQKYLSLTGHTKSFLPVIMNKDFFNRLPENYQTIVRDGARKYAVEQQRQLEIDSEDKAITDLEKEGMIVNKISSENLQKFVDAVQPVYKEFEGELGKDLFDLARKYTK